MAEESSAVKEASNEVLDFAWGSPDVAGMMRRPGCPHVVYFLYTPWMFTSTTSSGNPKVVFHVVDKIAERAHFRHSD